MKKQIDPNGKQLQSRLLAQTLKGLLNVSLAAVLSATLFTALPATGIGLGSPLFQPGQRNGQDIVSDTSGTALHVGLVVGHWGHDVGAICPDSLGGFREVDINYTIADLTRQYLQAEGIEVDLLKEFDEHLIGYQGDALISIHADTCEYIPELGTGYKIAEAMENKRPEQAARLMACLENRYGAMTGLRLDHRVTPDMSSYHAFSEVDPNTPAVIIETGYMNQDRELLTKNPSLAARGITAGIMCYLNREEISPE
ncbi:MAG: N-acetylmuramoyl-L-alanine amidase [Anaerolineales bacterium]